MESAYADKLAAYFHITVLGLNSDAGSPVLSLRVDYEATAECIGEVKQHQFSVFLLFFFCDC